MWKESNIYIILRSNLGTMAGTVISIPWKGKEEEEENFPLFLSRQVIVYVGIISTLYDNSQCPKNNRSMVPNGIYNKIKIQHQISQQQQTAASAGCT